jgi:hypothetical protein
MHQRNRVGIGEGIVGERRRSGGLEGRGFGGLVGGNGLEVIQAEGI